MEYLSKVTLAKEIVTAIVLLSPSVSANTLSPEQIQKIARSVTFRIEATGNGRSDLGSGVLIQKQGNNYFLATNAHVVCGNRNYLKSCEKHTKYKTIAPDGQSHVLTATAVKVLPNLDLAIVRFQSNRNYAVAEGGNSDKLTIDAPIYTAGFPGSSNSLSFHRGTIVASVKNRLAGDNGGYTIIYDAVTHPGMSGSGVFDRHGQIIAIHGQGDRYQEGTEANVLNEQVKKDLNFNLNQAYDAYIGQKIGTNRGIPIGYLQRELLVSGERSNSSSTQVISNPKTADEWFVTALNKAIDPNLDRIERDKQAAIQDCSQAIKLKPDYLVAYYLRARLWTQVNVPDRALNDYRTLSGLKPTSPLTYTIRSSARIQTNNFEGALTDLNQAINIDPNYAYAYTMRAGLYFSNNPSMAISDANRAIKLDPNNFINYIPRAAAKRILGDMSGAIQDVDRAAEIDPVAEIYRPYLGLGNSKPTVRSPTIEPNSAQFYLARASQKQRSGDLKGALADYDLAVNAQPTALMFAGRGACEVPQPASRGWGFQPRI
jgi:tetratricopeptide (TPR) repeat protein